MAEMYEMDEQQGRPRSFTCPTNLKRPNLANINRSRHGQEEPISDLLGAPFQPCTEEVDTSGSDPTFAPLTNFDSSHDFTGLEKFGESLQLHGSLPGYSVLPEFEETGTEPVPIISATDVSTTNANASLSKSPPNSLPPTASATQSNAPSASRPNAKVKSTRKNAWGNMSYADLITQAIESSADKRLTLAQIYEWMVKNIPYFKDKGDSNSSAGWKNSIRHNLSLHAKFKRMQNEGTGKSSWWIVNHDAKTEKAPRRRAVSMDSVNGKVIKSRSSRAAAKAKAEQLRKLKGTKSYGNGSSDPHFNKPMDYRPRTSSNASSIGGRGSPVSNQLYEIDKDSMLQSSGSHGFLPSLSTSLPSAFHFFDTSRTTTVGPTIPEIDTSGLESLRITHPEQMEFGQKNGNESAGFLQYNSGQQDANPTRMTNADAINKSPHLAILLTDSSSPMKRAQELIPKQEPVWNGPKDLQQKFPKSEFLMSQMPNQMNGNNQGYDGYSYNLNQFQAPPNQTIGQQDQMPFLQQSAGQHTGVQQYPGSSNQVAMNPLHYHTTTTDPNLNEIIDSDILNSSDLDRVMVNELALSSMLDDDGKRNFFRNFLDTENYELPNEYMTPSQPPELQINPDHFIARDPPGPSMDGCRMNMNINNGRFQHLQPGQTSSVGGAPNYTMQ